MEVLILNGHDYKLLLQGQRTIFNAEVSCGYGESTDKPFASWHGMGKLIYHADGRQDVFMFSTCRSASTGISFRDAVLNAGFMPTRGEMCYGISEIQELIVDEQTIVDRVAEMIITSISGALRQRPELVFADINLPVFSIEEMRACGAIAEKLKQPQLAVITS